MDVALDGQTLAHSMHLASLSNHFSNSAHPTHPGIIILSTATSVHQYLCIMKLSTAFDPLSQNAATALEEILSVMVQKEQTMNKSFDYIVGVPKTKTVVTVTDRTKLVDWCFSVIDKCEFERETVAIAMKLVDHILSKPSDLSLEVLQDRGQFQLLTMTALYVAIKIYETTAVLGSNFFSAISQDLYSVSEIEAMELNLLKGLSWCITPPTVVQMSHHILSWISVHVAVQRPTWAVMLEEVAYQAEHSVRDFYFVSHRPSTVAIAAIFNALSNANQVESRDILFALTSFIMKHDELDSIEIILDTKARLLSLAYGHELWSNHHQIAGIGLDGS